jgi:carotenoid cleavage dioxygenase-like enzyme
MHSLRSLFKQELYDNCSVNTAKIAEHWIAMTESNCQLAFDLDTLCTQGTFVFNNALKGQMSLAHPQLDIESGEIININIEIGKKIQYHIHKVAPKSIQQQLIKTVISDKLYYMHSFCLTKNYVILLKSPLTCHTFKLMLGLPFNNTLQWDKRAASSFVIIHRHTGAISELETDPFICLHSVNAFELNNDIVMDLICYTDGNPYEELYIANLTSEKPVLRRTNLRRYVIDINRKVCAYQVLCDKTVEFPNINDSKVHGCNYQFAYTAWMSDRNQPFLNAIQKLDVISGTALTWKEDNCYPGEPVFIANPQAKNEDDGLLLFIVLNTAAQCSSLVILNALDMQQTAEVYLPFHLPLGLHGQFYHQNHR